MRLVLFEGPGAVVHDQERSRCSVAILRGHVDEDPAGEGVLVLGLEGSVFTSKDLAVGRGHDELEPMAARRAPIGEGGVPAVFGAHLEVTGAIRIGRVGGSRLGCGGRLRRSGAGAECQ